MNGKMKGWNFRPLKLSANGSTTLQTLQDEKKRLDSRLAELPALITTLQHSTAVLETDIAWLNGLNNRRRRDWEKENSRSAEQAVSEGTATVVSNKAKITALKAEQERIPQQLTDINRQLDALVKGESTGLSKGLDRTSAQALGELELQKEQNQIAHEAALQQAEQQKAQRDSQTGMSSTMKTGLIVGSVLLVIAIIGYVIYKRKQAAIPLTTKI
jgi:hypothetical protein